MNKTGTKIVWAKAPGFQPWPGIIASPPHNAPPKPNEKSVTNRFSWIYFLGSYNYSWVKNDNIKTLTIKNLDEVKLNKKSKNVTTWKKAVEEVQNMLSKRKSTRLQKNDLKPFVSPKPKKVQKKNDPLPKKVNQDPVVDQTPKANKPQVSKIKRHVRFDIDQVNQNCTHGRETDSLSAQQSVDTNLIMPPPNKIRKHTQKFAEVSKTNPLDRIYGLVRLNFRVCGMIRNMLCAGHKIIIWSQDPDDLLLIDITADFAEDTAGSFKYVNNFEDFIALTDIFLMHTENVRQAQEAHGILKLDHPSENLLAGKSYVEMTSMELPDSLHISQSCAKQGVKYLEVQLQGSNSDFVKGALVILACGEKSLFNDVKSVFKATGRESFYLGSSIGKACNMNTILNSVRGTLVAGFTEALAMANCAGVSPETFAQITAQSSLSCPYLTGKAKIIVSDNYAVFVEEDLNTFQKDIKTALDLSQRIKLNVPVMAKANEVLKLAKLEGYQNEDVACVYKAIK